MILFQKWIPDIYKKIILNSCSIREYICNENRDVTESILRACCDEKRSIIEFTGPVQLEYSSLKDLAVIVSEILINQDYYFNSNTESPII